MKTLQQARDEYHDKLIEQEEMTENLREEIEKLRTNIEEMRNQVGFYVKYELSQEN